MTLCIMWMIQCMYQYRWPDTATKFGKGLLKIFSRLIKQKFLIVLFLVSCYFVCLYWHLLTEIKNYSKWEDKISKKWFGIHNRYLPLPSAPINLELFFLSRFKNVQNQEIDKLVLGCPSIEDKRHCTYMSRLITVMQPLVNKIFKVRQSLYCYF